MALQQVKSAENLEEASDKKGVHWILESANAFKSNTKPTKEW